MKHSLASRLLGITLSLCASNTVLAQPVTTVITHGWTLDNERAPWITTMAEAVIARSGGDGAILWYDQSSGEWNLEPGGMIDPNEPIVLKFRWYAEVEGINPGPEWGYAEAAADALYAALRDPAGDLAGFDLLENRIVHFIGHSRGACVNSEVVERLAIGDIPVDQVTTLDPHPVNGSFPSDAPFNPNWGDPVPQKWDNVTWGDNYWRNDADPFDFDGMPIENVMDVQLDEDALECCGYAFEHSDVHLWYHGTIDISQNPCDGEQCITDEMRDTWWWDGYHWTDHGYYYAVIGGGSADRPGPQPEGIPPVTVPILYNGMFDQGSFAGWSFHGGGGDGEILNELNDCYPFLQLGADSGFVLQHNRFWLGEDIQEFAYHYQILQTDSSSPIERLKVVLFPVGPGDSITLDEFDLNVQPGGWLPRSVIVDPSVPRNRNYTLAFGVINDASPESVVGVDRIRFIPFESTEGWTLLEVQQIPADGTTVLFETIPQDGVTYGLVADGTFLVAPRVPSDARFSAVSFKFPFWFNDVHCANQGTDHGIHSDLLGPGDDFWGEFRDDHVYTITFTGTGSGQPLDFKSFDTHYFDNSGSISVTLYEVPELVGDLDGDGSVGVSDLLILLANWGPCGDCDDCPADLDGDCSVGVKDLLILLGNWG